jgi:hypothetical protein
MVVARLEGNRQRCGWCFVRTPYHRKRFRAICLRFPLLGRVRLRLAGNGRVQKWRYARTIRLSQCEMMDNVRLCRYQNGHKAVDRDTTTRAFGDIQRVGHMAVVEGVV